MNTLLFALALALIALIGIWLGFGWAGVVAAPLAVAFLWWQAHRTPKDGCSTPEMTGRVSLLRLKGLLERLLGRRH